MHTYTEALEVDDLAVSYGAVTALNGLRDAGKLQPEQKVLIIGAAGGVGTYAVQLARAFGAVVTGVCSTSKTELVRAIGADEVIDYTREDFTDGTRQFELVIDNPSYPIERWEKAKAELPAWKFDLFYRGAVYPSRRRDL